MIARGAEITSGGAAIAVHACTVPDCEVKRLKSESFRVDLTIEHKGDAMGSELLDVIRIANREFQEFIDQASQKGVKIVESRGATRRLDKLDLRLKQVSQHLASASRSSAQAPEAAYQVMKYRDNLKALRGVLETLQFSLLAERAHLESLRGNMQAACAWATSVRDIS